MSRTLTLTVDPHPRLELGAFVCDWPGALGDTATTPEVQALLHADAEAPLARDEQVRAAVRDLLRHGGYKPTGRGKPASEYLVKASAEGPLRVINAAVDTCNAVSLHSGLPISVVDLGRAREPLRVGLAPTDAEYVFNHTGQTIRLGGLLCLFDADGPCANGVKDSQRTKTHEGTQRTLSLVWGTHALPGRAAAATGWYRALLERAGARTQDVELA